MKVTFHLPGKKQESDCHLIPQKNGTLGHGILYSTHQSIGVERNLFISLFFLA
jgi:hypothetical protein